MATRAPPCCVLCGTDECLNLAGKPRVHYLSMEQMKLLNVRCGMALPYNQGRTFRICNSIYKKMSRAQGKNGVSARQVVRMAIETAKGRNPDVLVSALVLLFAFR